MVAYSKKEVVLSIYFQGSWPACVAAGVLLFTKARRFGIRLTINIVDEDETPKTSILTKRSVTSVNSRQKKSKAISDRLS